MNNIVLPAFDRDTNILIITLDSCRWDTFQSANCSNLKSKGVFYKAFANGTYTMPAHLSIYCGILPNTLEFIPYYNRFCCNLFRIAFRKTDLNAYCTFSPDNQNIVNGFANIGYRTILVAAVEWFKHPLLTRPFQDCHYTGINLEEQVQIILNVIECNQIAPFFSLLNVGETHDPYLYKGKIEPSLTSRARMRCNCKDGYIRSEHQKQIDACSYIDNTLRVVIDKLETIHRKTLVVVCGDHGECFGEDNLYGHGFYHPKIFEVPLGIFMIK